MKKKTPLFKKENRFPLETDSALNKKTGSAYDQAYLEWSNRLGNAITQAKNWQRIGLLSLVLCFLLLIALILFMSTQKTEVYVAEVKPNQTVQYIKMPQTLTPTEGEELYFIGQFIQNIMSLPLDPVIAKQNWLTAYAMTDGSAKTQLNTYAQKTNPLAWLGKHTQAVEIGQTHIVSPHSIQFQWTVNIYNENGSLQNTEAYSGVFTLARTPFPTTQADLLRNPFGLKIVYFTLNKEASS